MGLFSTTHNHHTTEHVTREVTKNVNVTEKRAATDESIRLLNEFTEKAKENIIQKVKIDENHLKAIAIFYHDDYVQDRIVFHIKFELNGREVIIKDYIDSSEWRSLISTKYMGLGCEDVYKLVHKHLSEMIALELMKQSPDFIESLSRGR